MVRFIIVRHGFSAGNKGGYFSGQLDLPLDGNGILQGQMTSDYVSRSFTVDAVYSSDLSRAADTVRPLCDAIGIPLITTPELRELHVGLWQGM
ncbi:MAG: histidine phosphatase family protein, partial [Clostridia bacterium]|nr:histidine phosphatase family protein [Clostridia bacterium]